MDRIKKLCTYLDACDTFADVGCDHGYCTEYMLKNSLCKRAIISDVSEKCLDKARNLLQNYIKDGKCTAVCCDGLTRVEPNADLVLIAGMGGEEIIRILKDGFIPKRFVFQPMKNAPELRKYLLENGCAIDTDDIFYAGKYYFIIKGRCCGNNCGNNSYTYAQLQFGRDSLNNRLICGLLDEEIKKNQSYLQNSMTAQNRQIIEARIKFLSEVKNK